MNAIEVKNVCKRYGKVAALDDVSFTVGKGEVFGLIGPDGAGKTTMFRILCTLLLPDKGTATVDGCDVVKHRLTSLKRLFATLSDTILDIAIGKPAVDSMNNGLYSA